MVRCIGWILMLSPMKMVPFTLSLRLYKCSCTIFDWFQSQIRLLLLQFFTIILFANYCQIFWVWYSLLHWSERICILIRLFPKLIQTKLLNALTSIQPLHLLLNSRLYRTCSIYCSFIFQNLLSLILHHLSLVASIEDLSTIHCLVSQNDSLNYNDGREHALSCIGIWIKWEHEHKQNNRCADDRRQLVKNRGASTFICGRFERTLRWFFHIVKNIIYW